MINLKDYRNAFAKAGVSGLQKSDFLKVLEDFTKDCKPLGANGEWPKELLELVASETVTLAAPKPADVNLYEAYKAALRKARKEVLGIDKFGWSSKSKGSNLEEKYPSKGHEKFREIYDAVLADNTKTRGDLVTLLDRQNSFLSSIEPSKGNKFSNYKVEPKLTVSTADCILANIYGKKYLVSKSALESNFKLVDGTYILLGDGRTNLTKYYATQGGQVTSVSSLVVKKLEPVFNSYGIVLLENPGESSGYILVSLRHRFISKGNRTFDINELYRAYARNGVLSFCSSCGAISHNTKSVILAKKEYIVCENCVGLEGFRQQMREAKKTNYNDPIALHGLNPKEFGHKRLYGVELEYNSSSSDNLVASCLVDICESHWAAKSDGSVREGVEFVSMPATLEQHREGFKRISSSPLFEKFTLSGAGIHVHVNRKSLSERTIFKLIRFMAEPSNGEFITKMAGRAANTYCQRSAKRQDIRLDKTAKRITCGGKYQAINTTHHNTIEFRIFNSTKKESDFMQRLQFVDSILLFAEHNQLQDMTAEKFIEWYKVQPNYILKNWVEMSLYLAKLGHIDYKKTVKPTPTKRKIAKCA